MQALAKQFVCVGDEVWTLDNTASPGAKLWKDYVRKAAGKVDFGATTKQGVYAMTPDGDFLAGHFARHEKADTIALLRDALQRWNAIVAEKNLKPKPIPNRGRNRTWGADGLAGTAGGDAGNRSALILQVCVRDLPFKGERQPGPAAYKGAFNQTWVDLTREEMLDLLPKGGKTAVPEALVRKIGREALLDFVRGQTDPWPEAAIKKAVLTVEAAPGGLRYQGEFAADEATRGMDLKLFGKASFDAASGRFRSFELAAVGTRRGSSRVNFRFQEPPSPIGFAFIIEDQYDRAKESPKAATPAAAPASVDAKPAVRPEALRERDVLLRARVAEDLKAGRKTPFSLSVMGAAAEITALDDKGGAVKLASGGSAFDLLWADLTLQDRRNLAVARIRPSKPAEDLALAAFYQAAAGDTKAAEILLRALAPAEAEDVRRALK